MDSRAYGLKISIACYIFLWPVFKQQLHFQNIFIVMNIDKRISGSNSG